MHLLEIFNTNNSIIALLGVMSTLLTNYIIQKKRTKIDTYTVDMTSLSKEQSDFRLSILDELNTCRKKCDELKLENDSLRVKSLKDNVDKNDLLIKVANLQEEIIELRDDIEKIINKVNLTTQ